MPDDPQKPDNLDQDRTFVGERKKVSDDTHSLPLLDGETDVRYCVATVRIGVRDVGKGNR